MNEPQSHKFSVLIFFSILLCEKTVDSIESRAIISSQCTGDQLHTHYCDEIVKIKVTLNARLDAIDSNVNFFHQKLNELIKKDASSQQGCSTIHRTPISLAQCRGSRMIFDSFGTYMKSVCDVGKCFSYYEAEKFCFDNGMDLLIIENEDVYDEVSKFALASYPGIPEVWTHNPGLWINGRLNDNEWYVYKNLQKQAIGKGIRIVKERQYAGNCAVLKRNRSFELRNYDCNKCYNFLCEYQSVL